MAIFADRVAVASTSVGTGTMALGAAVASYRSFATALPDGLIYYGIVDEATGAWEIGEGTLSGAGATLARTTVYSSSNGGALVNFAAGTKIVYAPVPAYALNMTGMPDGTALAPGMPFKLDVDTGFFRPASNAVGIATGGAVRGTFTDTGVDFSVPVTVPAGSLAAPSILFEGATGGAGLSLGAWNFTSPQDSIDFSFGGALSAGVTSAGIHIGPTPTADVTGGGGLRIASAIAAANISRFSADVNGGVLRLYKSRSTSIGDYTSPPLVGDRLGSIVFLGADGTAAVESGSITFIVESTPSAGLIRSAFVFKLQPPTVGSPIEQMRITADGDVGIGTPTPSTKLHVNGPIRKGSYTVATLPSAATVGAGTQVYVTDAPLGGGGIGTGGVAESNGTSWFYVNAGAYGIPNSLSLALKSVDTDAYTGGNYIGYGGTHPTQASTGDNPFPTWTGTFSLAVEHAGPISSQYIVQTATIYTGVALNILPTQRIRQASGGGVWSAWSDVHTSLGQQPGTAALPSYTWAYDTDTGLYSPAANAVGISNAGVETARFATTGLMLGLTAPVTGASGGLQIAGTAATPVTADVAMSRFSNNATGPFLRISKSRGTLVGDFTVPVVSADSLGTISFLGSDGVGGNAIGCSIRGSVDGVVAAGSVPARVSIWTNPEGGTATVERMRVTNAGDVGIGTTAPSTKLHVNGPIRCASYTVATLPSASVAGAGSMIYVSNAAGGPVHATGNGTNWLIMGTQTIIA